MVGNALDNVAELQRTGILCNDDGVEWVPLGDYLTPKNDSKIEFDELRTVPFVEKTDDGSDRECEMVVSRLAEIRFIDPHTGITLSSMNVPYGSSLYHKWNVRRVSCVPGSPIACAAMTPTASPF